MTMAWANPGSGRWDDRLEKAFDRLGFALRSQFIATLGATQAENHERPLPHLAQSSIGCGFLLCNLRLSLVFNRRCRLLCRYSPRSRALVQALDSGV